MQSMNLDKVLPWIQNFHFFEPIIQNVKSERLIQESAESKIPTTDHYFLHGISIFLAYSTVYCT